jgi:hypothetical protein
MTRRNRLLLLPALTFGLLVASAGARSSGVKLVRTRAPKPYSSHALRGLMVQTNKVKATQRKNIAASKKTSPATKAPLPVLALDARAAKKTDKDSQSTARPKVRLHDEYTHFVEACQAELIADVINGGIIHHSQFTSFIYGYCRGSDIEGPRCSKNDEEKGFDHLPNDMKLMYIKSFCPTDVDGQMSCLHGINDRGREYEFNEELESMCHDLEKLMMRNDILDGKRSKLVS